MAIYKSFGFSLEGIRESLQGIGQKPNMLRYVFKGSCVLNTLGRGVLYQIHGESVIQVRDNGLDWYCSNRCGKQ